MLISNSLLLGRDMALAERHSYWPDGWGLGPGDAKGAMGATVNAHDGLKCPCKPSSDYPTSIAAPNALLSPS